MYEKNYEKTGYLMVFIAGVLWGAIGIFSKELSRLGSSIELTSFLRIFSAFLILLVITVVKMGWKGLRVDRKTLMICALLGLVCNGICGIVYNFAIKMIGMAVSAVLMNTAPIFALIFSIICFGEKFTGKKALVIVLNVTGCILAATNGRFDIATLSIAGILCGIASGFCYAMTAIIGRFASDRTNSLVMSTYSYLFASLFLWVWMRPWEVSVTVTPEILLWGFGFGLIPTAMAYILYYSGLQKIKESSKVPVIASIEVVVAILFGVVLYQEELGAVGIVGILFVLGSILLMNAKGR